MISLMQNLLFTFLSGGDFSFKSLNATHRPPESRLRLRRRDPRSSLKISLGERSLVLPYLAHIPPNWPWSRGSVDALRNIVVAG